MNPLKHIKRRIKFDHFDTENEGHWKITICHTLPKFNDDYSQCLLAVTTVETHICVDGIWNLWALLRKCEIDWFKAEFDFSYHERLQNDPDHFKRERKKTVI